MITATIKTADLMDTEENQMARLKNPNTDADTVYMLLLDIDDARSEYLAARHPNADERAFDMVIRLNAGSMGWSGEESGLELLELIAQHPNASRDNLELVRSLLEHASDEEAAADILELVSQHSNA